MYIVSNDIQLLARSLVIENQYGRPLIWAQLAAFMFVSFRSFRERDNGFFMVPLKPKIPPPSTLSVGVESQLLS